VEWARFWWTVGLASLCVVVALLGWLGWRRRAARQSGFPPIPEPPADLGDQLAAVTGVYVSTVTTGRWQDRIVAHGAGRRAKATVELRAAGVLIDRVAEEPIWIPRNAFQGVREEPGVAGKVIGVERGILLLTWRWGDALVDSGVRCDDDDAQVAFVRSVEALLTPQPGATS
jgi:hypothetical protein